MYKPKGVYLISPCAIRCAHFSNVKFGYFRLFLLPLLNSSLFFFSLLSTQTLFLPLRKFPCIYSNTLHLPLRTGNCSCAYATILFLFCPVQFSSVCDNAFNFVLPRDRTMRVVLCCFWVHCVSFGGFLCSTSSY